MLENEAFVNGILKNAFLEPFIFWSASLNINNPFFIDGDVTAKDHHCEIWTDCEK
ncbi:hypothetical protein [Virgibacillus sp. L01]|uniref:hypothetical protein n=1 Tax=Virgibacillus sp. L01 TaxID=3457429 RepID=UPI003FD1A71D